MEHNKLVRDRIPELLEGKGITATFHTADEGEYRQRLKDKLQEEVLEVLQEDNIAEELADVLEVIDAIMVLKNISPEQVAKIKQQKVEKRWWFSQKIILEQTSES